MKLENQVCSSELAKKLKDLGLNQKSLFCYQPLQDDNLAVWPRNFNVYEFRKAAEDERIAAFTVAELSEMLPAYIDVKNREPFNNYYLSIIKRTAKNIQYIANYVCDTIPGEEINNPHFVVESTIRQHDEKLADCLAKVLIDLLENKLMELPS